jgi:hypothetical protein
MKKIIIGTVLFFVITLSVNICCLPNIEAAKYGQRRVQTLGYPNTTIVDQKSKVLRYFPNAIVEVKTFYIDNTERLKPNQEIQIRIGHHHNPSFLTSLNMIYAMTFKGGAIKGIDY